MTGHCAMCQRTKPRSEFHRNQGTCKPCHTIRQRAYRRTLRGFLDQKYTAMSKRVRGKDARCASVMLGMPIISRAEFLSWAYRQVGLPELFDAYKKSVWQFRLCPVVDRIDVTKGYVLNNIQIITQSENSLKRWRDNPNHRGHISHEKETTT